MSRPSFAATLLLPFVLLMFSGCATVSGPGEVRNRSAIDPLEDINRTVFEFNKVVDKALLRPIAEVYQALVPEPVSTGISNFFSNLDDVVVVANDLMQLKIKQAGQDTGRVLLNTLVGLLGFFDPATEYGWPKHHEDFGQTLGYWGVPSGPYLMLPLLGPSTLRDGPSMLVDWMIDPRAHFHGETDEMVLYGLTSVNIVDNRASLLGAERLLDTASIDDYVFMRDAYLQRRASFVKDGQLSVEDQISDDDLFGKP